MGKTGIKRRHTKVTKQPGHKTRKSGPVPVSGLNAEQPGLQSRSDLFEAEILNGLAPVCQKELRNMLGTRGQVLDSNRPDHIIFEYSGNRSDLLKLRTVVSVFQLLYFKVPHPLMVTQEGNLKRLIDAIAKIQGSYPFTTFRIGAAGSGSDTFKKIKRIIAKQSGLINDEDDGQMSIRFRRSRLKPFGWDVLIRLTPLPLSARPWRVENMPGALNAAIAAAIVLQMNPDPGDRFLNLMCGSGTLLAERACLCPARSLTGIDISHSALEKAAKNLSFIPSAVLLQEDARRLSLGDASVNAICADLPWGRLIGKPHELEALYFDTMREATRVCIAEGQLAILTQENELFEKVLSKYTPYWTPLLSFRVKQADYRPKVYFMRRTDFKMNSKAA